MNRTDLRSLPPSKRVYLEDGAPADLVAFVEHNTEQLAAQADVIDPFGGGVWNCYVMVGVWARALRAEGWVVEELSGECRRIGHAWLAVGERSWLLDPTAAQFNRPVMALADYMVDPGQSLGFRSWRRRGH
jgi:hypothetical protein